MHGLAAHGNSSKASADQPINLSKSRDSDSNLPTTLDTIDDVEGDCAPVNMVKKEAVPIKGEAEPKVASPVAPSLDVAEKVKEEPLSDKSKSDEEDLETDFVATKSRTPKPMSKGFEKKIQMRAPDSRNTSQKTAEATRKMSEELAREKLRARTLQEHMGECEDMVIDAVMKYAVTGDHLYFISQFRHFLTVGDEYGDNSLHMAVINGQGKALKDMLDICVATKTMPAVNQLNDKQQTPLHLATILRNVEMVEVLLKHEANPCIKDHNGNTCFHIAARGGDYKTLELLCQWTRLSGRDGAAVDDFNYEGDTALHKAVQSDSMECIRELINSGASVNVGDRTSGKTPLHHAVQKNNVVTTAELVLQPNADVNALAYDGNSALHLAVSLKNYDICRMLIKAGADPNIKNRDYELTDNREEFVGRDVYELCEEDSRMRTTIETAKRKQTKSPYFFGSIQTLPKEKVNRLSQLLDQESQDWKRLASDYFELSSLVSYMEGTGKPTATLLDYLARSDKTIKDLTTGLQTIARRDCVDVIEKWNMGATGRHGSGKVDSGFVDSYVSGNTRSGLMK